MLTCFKESGLIEITFIKAPHCRQTPSLDVIEKIFEQLFKRFHDDGGLYYLNELVRFWIQNTKRVNSLDLLDSFLKLNIFFSFFSNLYQDHK